MRLSKKPGPRQPQRDFEREFLFQLRRIVYRLDGIILAIQHGGTAGQQAAVDALADTIAADNAALAQAVANETPPGA